MNLVRRTDTMGVVTASNGSPSKRNKVGVVSQDVALHNNFGEVLTRQGFDLTIMNLEELAKVAPQNFYFVDIVGLDNYYAVTGQIKAVREQRPDSELVLLHAPSTLSRPQVQVLKSAVDRYLVPYYPRPTNETVHGQVSDYKKGLYGFVDTTLSQHIKRFLAQPSMIKVGGSIVDLFDKYPEVYTALLEEIKKLHGEGYQIILATGGGPRREMEGRLSQAYGTAIASRDVLELQAKNIAELLGDEGVYIPPTRVRSFDFNRDFLEKYIPVFSLSGLPNIPEKDSDTHTLAAAERLNLYKVIFAKDTDGVYSRDPYREPRTVRAKLGFLPLSGVENNQFFPTIYASDILNGVIDRRDSEGKGEHLIETTALLYLKDRTQHVRTVQVVNGTKPKLLRDALDGNLVGSYILKG